MASAPETKPLTRSDLAQFFKRADGSPDMRAIIAFENALKNILEQAAAINNGPFVTTAADASLPAAKVLTGSANIEIDDTTDVELDLTDTGVVAGPYGGATFTISGTVDAKGRWTAIAAHALSTTNVAEGTNLYFTNARARAALSGVGQINYNSTTGVIDTTGADAALSGGPVTALTCNNGVITAVSNLAGDDAVIAGEVITDIVVNDGVVTSISSTAGFSGTGAYTNFTFTNGICTAAS